MLLLLLLSNAARQNPYPTDWPRISRGKDSSERDREDKMAIGVGDVIWGDYEGGNRTGPNVRGWRSSAHDGESVRYLINY